MLQVYWKTAEGKAILTLNEKARSTSFDRTRRGGEGNAVNQIQTSVRCRNEANLGFVILLCLPLSIEEHYVS